MYHVYNILFLFLPSTYLSGKANTYKIVHLKIAF